MINWVTALKPEAAGLIDGLKLSHQARFSAGGLVVYADKNGENRLIISGVGKTNAAAAVAWLAAQCDQDRPAAWVNFGIAGHQAAPLGALYRAGRITDKALDRSWYPSVAWSAKKEANIEVGEVLTVDHPTRDYPGTGQVVEMEAAGFVATATRFASLELVHAVKVVSDNAENDIDQIDAKSVETLCNQVLPEVIDWSHLLVETVREIGQLEQPDGIDALCQEYHFTVTSRHQIVRLVQRSLALGLYPSLRQWLGEHKFTSGKEVIAAHRKLLADAE